MPGHVPPPPEDIISTAKENMPFMKDGKLQVHYGPTRFYLREHWIKEKYPDFILLTNLMLSPTDHAPFLFEHGKLLQEEFGINAMC